MDEAYSCTDWERVLSLARSQTVSGLLWRGVDMAMEEGLELPETVLARLAAEVDACERRYARMQKLTLELLAFYGSRGLHPVLLKGLDSAALYDIPSLRESGDIDLYFSENEFLAAIPKEAVHNADNSWSYVFRGVEVELHDHILDIERPSARREAQRIASEVPSGSVEGLPAEVRGLSPRMRILLLSSHLLKHVLGRGIGLRQVCDYALARAACDYDRRIFEADCRALGLSRWVAVLDNLCVRHLGLDGNFSASYAERERRRLDTLSDRLLRRLLDEGNFGRESGRGKGALNTFMAFLSNMGFSLKLAPGEAFYTVLSLAKGRLKKPSPSGKTQNKSR